MAPTTERTDAQVVRDVLAGDRDAYRLLVRRYGDVLYGHALRMSRSPDVAADLVQRAFVKGYQKLGSCDDPARVGAWLFRILANLSLDHARSPRRRDVALERLPELRGDAPDPSVEAARSEFRERLEAAMTRLTPQQREAFLLKHVDGLPYAEIAGLMGLSVPALKMRVHRAREALRDLLEVYA
jgi:RNA polymerase sigma-70 factor (ECF subfamily)